MLLSEDVIQTIYKQIFHENYSNLGDLVDDLGDYFIGTHIYLFIFLFF